MRRPPSFIGAMPESLPPMPCVNPGTTPVSENCAGVPRFHELSNYVPSL